MTVEEYLASKALADRKKATLLLDIRQSYDAALETLRDEEGNVNLSALEGDRTVDD